MSVSTEIISATCNDCAYYAPRSMYCMEWQTNGMRGATEACGRFIPCEGSFSSSKTTGVSAKKLSAKAKKANMIESETTPNESKLKSEAKPTKSNELPAEPDKPDKDDLITRVAELLLQGHGRKSIAKKLGVSKNTVGKYIGWTLDAGKVVRVGRGRYAAPGSTDALESEKQLDSLVVAKHILGGLTQAEIAARYKVYPQSISYHVNKAVERGELVRVGLGKYKPGPALATEQTEPETDTPDTVEVDKKKHGGLNGDHGSQEPNQLDKLTHRLDELQGTLQADLLKLGEWALRLDKRCDQLDARIDRLEEIVIRRLTSLGLSVAGIQNDIVRVDQQLQNELERVVTNQRIISDQLDEVRDMVAEMQSKQLRRSEPVGFGSSDVTNRLLSILEAQQRIMERQLVSQSAQRLVGLEAKERVGVERANRTDNQEVA